MLFNSFEPAGAFGFEVRVEVFRCQSITVGRDGYLDPVDCKVDPEVSRRVYDVVHD
jgi:hypothetical protein